MYSKQLFSFTQVNAGRDQGDVLSRLPFSGKCFLDTAVVGVREGAGVGSRALVSREKHFVDTCWALSTLQAHWGTLPPGNAKSETLLLKLVSCHGERVA